MLNIKQALPQLCSSATHVHAHVGSVRSLLKMCAASVIESELTVQVAYAVWHQALLEGSQSWACPSTSAAGLAWGSFAVAQMLTRPNPGRDLPIPHAAVPADASLMHGSC